MNWKKVGLILLALFLVYFVVRSPVESAEVVRNVASSIADAANSLAVALTTFLQTLF